MALPPLDNEVAKQVISNFLNTWIEPEIYKRMSDGKIPNPFPLSKAQVLIDFGKSVSILLNDEIKFSEQNDPIENFTLPEEVAHCGHLTYIIHERKYSFSFDLKYNKNYAEVYITRAKQYIDIAKTSLSETYISPCLELLYSAYEFLLKAELMIMPVPNILTSKKHGHIRSQINLRSKMFHCLKPYVEIYNKLFNERDHFKYGISNNFTFTYDECTKMIEMADQLYLQYKSKLLN